MRRGEAHLEVVDGGADLSDDAHNLVPRDLQCIAH